MTKAAPLSLGFILLLAAAAMLPAQTSPTDVAVNEAVLRQANTIILRQKLLEAKNTALRGDLPGAAKLYEDANTLVGQIGSGIPEEKAQTISGLASTWLTLARQAQSQGDLHEADIRVKRVLKVDPQNPAALAFKKNNDKSLASMRGKMPDEATSQQVQYIAKDKIEAGTLVQDGKLLYEMGKFDEAEVKLKEAVRLDPDNESAFYYMNLVKQARYDRETRAHTVSTQERMVQVENTWVKPVGRGLLPVPNPYALTNLVHTGAGREAIYSKLDHIRLDSVSWPEGLPLIEVLRNLSEQAKLRDPDKKGINFIFNPNSAAAPAGTTPAGGTTTIDPATGLPVTAPTVSGESVDASSINVKLTLSDVRLADVLDAIVLVADHPIKYSVEDYAIVFSGRGPETMQLEMRTFKVDPNTFYQGLESVGAASFGSANNTSTGGGTGGTSGGGQGGQGGSSAAAVAIVNAFPGASGARQSGGAIGTGAGGGGGGGGGQGGGGLSYVTTTNATANISVAARNFFTTLGLTLNPPKSVFFNDRLGVLFVYATAQDLDTIEKAIQVLNMTPPQVHIKARFIEVAQDDNTALGFDWYLGQVNMGGGVVGNGGTSPSLNNGNPTYNGLPTSSGFFPGQTPASQIVGSASDQVIGNLVNANSGIPTIATITGILTNPNFRMVIHALQQRAGTEQLAEPEATTLSGRQTQMRATDIITIISSFSFQQGTIGGTTTTGTTTGP
ncbi:MAG: tetratricopeptide repeat protein [Verrucomicrobiota bacterium]|jgi:tetratricopeptide (TPR) repeat protein